MSNYVYDNTALFFPKTDLNPIPGGADSTKYVQAVDWNTLNQAVDDIKGVLRGAVWIGLNDQTSDPLPSSIPAYLWLTTTNVLNLKNGGTNYPLVLGTRQVATGTGLSGGGDLSADRTISLANTTVTPGSYTSADITVDAQGRITAAANGTGSVPTSRLINTGTGLSGGGDLTADRTISLANTAVSPGSYTFSSITVDAQGRLTAASTGGIGTTLSSATLGSVLFVNTGGILDQDNTKLFWDSTNKRLGIGNAAPSTALTVTGTTTTTNATITAMTAGSVLFAGTSGAVSQDNSNLFWDNTNKRLGIATTSPTHSLHIKSAAAANTVKIENSNTAGISTLTFFDSSAVTQGAFGWANSAFNLTHLRSTLYWFSEGSDITLANVTKNEFRFGLTDGSTFMEMANGSSAAVSGASLGRLRYTTTGQKFQVSLNGASYVDLITQVSGAGTANTLVKYTAAGVIANSRLTDDGTTITLNGNTQVGGAAAATLGVINVAGSGLPTSTGGGSAGSMYVVQPASNNGLVVARAVADTGGAKLTLYHTRNADASVKTAVVNGDTLGVVTYQGASDSSTVNAGAEITANVSAAVSSGIVPTSLLLRTTNTSGVLTTALTIGNDQSALFAAQVDMASHKIVNLTNGASAQDAAAFGQIATAVNAAVSGTNNTLTKFTGTNTVGNASITDTGSLVSFTTDTSYKSHASFAGSQVVQTTKAQQTTDATQTDITLLTISDLFAGWVQVTVVARDEAGTERALYGKIALVYRQGGGATIQGAVQDIQPDVETSAGLDATITVNSNDVRLSVTGLAATTIDWVATVRYQLVSTNA